MSEDKRLVLAVESEINSVYGYPVFSNSEQQYYFALSEQELAIIETLKIPEIKLYFVVLLGYFKSRTIFFKIDFEQSQNDLTYLAKKVLNIKGNYFLKAPSKNTITKLKQLIYELFKIESETKQKQLIAAKLAGLARYNINPVDIFKGFIAYLQDNNIPIPAYTTIQTSIGNVLAKEEKRLAAIIDQYLPKYAVNSIEKLLTANDGLFPITTLKTNPKSFNTHQLKNELEKYTKYNNFFAACKKIIPKFEISKNNVDYYSSLAIYYNAFRLANLPRTTSRLYIICFAYYQSYKIINNLIDGFVHYVRKYEQEAEEYAKQEIYNMKTEIGNHRSQLIKILTIFNNTRMNSWQFKEVKEKVFKFISVNAINKIIRLLRSDPMDKKELLWNFHKENHQATTINLRPLFMAIGFDYAKLSEDLKKAADFITEAFKVAKPLGGFKLTDFPQDFINDNIKQYFYIKKTPKNKGQKSTLIIEPYKYEYLVYQQIEAGIHSGVVHSNASIEYKDLEVDLDINDYEKQRQLVQDAYMPVLTDDIKLRLAEHKELIEAQIINVNERINNGKNKRVKIKKQGDVVTWSLPYKKIQPDFNNPFYDRLPQINIIDLVVFVDEQSHFISPFSHIKTHGSQKISDYDYTLAGIIANAMGITLYKMAEISRLNYDKLLNIHNSRIRLETITSADNILMEEIKKLPIFEYYNINELLHGGIDGAKMDVRLQTFKSRYLRKYFKEKGVSSLTMLVNNIAVSSKIITGHESHYLFDLLHNNTSTIRPNIISTDTEGSNNLNYALLELITTLFAPHYKNITKKAKTIGTFNSVKQYEDYIIKPHYKFKEDLIIEEWPNIQKIYVSLLSGDQTQSTIVRKLSSHRRKNRTKDALWEYNAILRSIYLLMYIDDAGFRRNVRKALNRTEGYHQLERAILNVGGGELRGKSDIELSIWNACTRLISNAIVYYNSYLLSQLLIDKKNNLTDKEKKLLIRISPIAWQHLIFTGAYDFSLRNTININNMVDIIKKRFNEELSKTKDK